MTSDAKKPRILHLDVSQNPLEKNHEQLTTAIAGGLAPTSLTMQDMDYQNEELFGELLLAMSLNTTIQVLDLSRLTLPCDISPHTCQAFEKLFAENKTLEFLDISGEESRIENTALGEGLCEAIQALERNTALRVLRIQHQELSRQGAAALANVIRTNTTLQEIHCENNKIQVSGFTDLVNSLRQNTTLLYLPSMEDGRREHLRITEAEAKTPRTTHGLTALPSMSSSNRTSAVKDKITSKVGLSNKQPEVHYLTAQDVAAALRLVNEVWSRQVHRLNQYLTRNINLNQGISVPLEIDEEEFERDDRGERVDSADVLEIMKRAAIDTTPTVEKEVQLNTSGTNSIVTTDSDEAAAGSRGVSMDALHVALSTVSDDVQPGAAGTSTPDNLPELRLPDRSK